MVGAKRSAWVQGVEAVGVQDRESGSGRVWSVREEGLGSLARSTDVEGLVLETGLITLWTELSVAWTGSSEMGVGFVVAGVVDILAS